MTEASTPRRDGRWRAISWRKTVHAYLIGRGLVGLTLRDTSGPIRLSEAILEMRSDIRGLRDFGVVTRVDLRQDLSEALDKAVTVAEDDDRPFPVVLQWRKGRDDPGASYAIMRISDWCSVVQLLAARPT